MPGFQSFFRFLHHFVMVKLASSSIRVKMCITVISGGSFILGNPISLQMAIHKLVAISDKKWNSIFKISS